MDASTKSRIEGLIATSPIFVFMKGSKLMPQCGFSNNVVQILHSLGVTFETFDVLSDPEIRQGIKEFSTPRATRPPLLFATSPLRRAASTACARALPDVLVLYVL